MHTLGNVNGTAHAPGLGSPVKNLTVEIQETIRHPRINKTVECKKKGGTNLLIRFADGQACTEQTFKLLSIVANIKRESKVGKNCTVK